MVAVTAAVIAISLGYHIVKNQMDKLPKTMPKRQKVVLKREEDDFEQVKRFLVDAQYNLQQDGNPGENLNHAKNLAMALLEKARQEGNSEKIKRLEQVLTNIEKAISEFGSLA